MMSFSLPEYDIEMLNRITELCEINTTIVLDDETVKYNSCYNATSKKTSEVSRLCTVRCEVTLLYILP